MPRYMVLPFVVACITDTRGRILIGQHPNVNTKPYPGFWDFPGGKLEPFETIEQCIRREVLEELSVEVLNLELFDVYHHDKSHFLPGMTNMVPGVAVCYLVSITGTIVPTEQNNVHYAGREELKLLRNVSTPWMLYFLRNIFTE